MNVCSLLLFSSCSMTLFSKVWKSEKPKRVCNLLHFTDSFVACLVSTAYFSKMTNLLRNFHSERDFKYILSTFEEFPLPANKASTSSWIQWILSRKWSNGFQHIAFVCNIYQHHTLWYYAPKIPETVYISTSARIDS